MKFEAEHILLFDKLQIRYYGIIIVVAMLVAATIASRLAKRDKRDPDHIWGALTWAIIPGIIFARLWFVFFPPATQLNNSIPEDHSVSVAVSDAEVQSGLDALGLTIGTGTTVTAVAANSPAEAAGFKVGDKISSINDASVATADSINTQFANSSAGASLTFALTRNVPQDTSWYLRHFFDLQNGAIAIWSGGLSIFGAVIGGALGAYIYMRRNKLEYSAWLDIAAVALPVGQAIGRWANYVNQELYGTPTNLPWGITIDSAHRVAPYTSTIDYPPSQLFHPLFLYESLWSILAFIVLLNIFLRYRRRLLPGDIFLMYIMQYSFIRFLLEFIRVEVAYIPGTTINSSQAITLVAFVAALLFFIYRHRPGAVEAARAAAKTRAAERAKSESKPEPSEPEQADQTAS